MSIGKQEPFYLVDGSGLIFRAYYGIRAPMTAKDGTPTNAVFGFVRLLSNLVRDRNAKRMLVVFDAKGPTFRNDIFPDYKANRSAPPEDLVPQFALCREATKQLGIGYSVVDGVEADDVIGTLARRWTQLDEEHKVVIVTADKDMCQLVNPQVTLWDGKEKHTDSAGVIEKFGVPPDQVIDILALAGDSSDNIPGVPGIGPKTAATLIQKYGSVEETLSEAPNIKGKRGQNLVEFADDALLSKDLATIRTQLTLTDNLETSILQEPNAQELGDFFRALNFRRFLDEFGLNQSGTKKTELSTEHYQCIQNSDALDEVTRNIRLTKKLSFDLETTSLDALAAEIVGIAVAWAPGHAAYIPVAHSENTAQIPLPSVLETLRPLLVDGEIALYGQNLKYDLKVLARYLEIDDIAVTRDSMIAAYLLEPGRRNLSLDDLAMEVFGHSTVKFSEVMAQSSAASFADVALESATRYACEDADIALRLCEHFEEPLKRIGLDTLEREIEMPLLSVLARMECSGIRLDSERLNVQSEEIGAQIETLRTQIFEMSGQTFNLDSPKQLAKVLFEDLGLEPIKKTKTGPSTDQQVLNALKHEHPVAGALLDYRQLVKLKNTYLDTLPTLVRSDTQRIHTTFRQAVTATGRQSSSEPNLQNIPIRTDEGRRIREAFVPEPGNVLISADYSQIELRLLAHYARDEALLEAFRSHADVHRRTASEVFGIPEAEVTDTQRRQAKSVNFGLMYGMSAFRLSNEIGVPQSEARLLISKYFQQYSGVRDYFDSAVENAQTEKQARTLFGRVRLLPQIASSTFTIRQQNERLAINTPIQGSAADILKIAMNRLDKALREFPTTRMLLTVHDELIFECPKDKSETIAKIVKTEMESAAELAVPLVVDVGVGGSWASIH